MIVLCDVLVERRNAIHTNVDENLILKIAHTMKESGLAAAGFEYDTYSGEYVYLVCNYLFRNLGCCDCR
jgi:hypothetical protein